MFPFTPDPKSLFRSKTFWVNLLMAAAAYGGFLPGKWGITVVGLANVLLRLFTDTPVSLTAPLSNTGK